MGPMRIEKGVDKKKRKINVILTPNPNKVLKKLRAENCAVHVFVPGGAEDELKDLPNIQSDSVTVITRAGLKRLKGLQSELQSNLATTPERSRSRSSSSSSSSSSSNISSESSETMSNGWLGRLFAFENSISVVCIDSFSFWPAFC